MEKELQHCGVCGEDFPFDNFHKDKSKKFGISNTCKTCAKEQRRLWYLKNKDTEAFKKRTKEYSSNYYQENKEKVRARNDKWKADNPDKVRELDKKHRKNRANYKQCAKTMGQDVEVTKGNIRHHWSYQKEHYRDIIELTTAGHGEVHRLTDYIEEIRMYKVTATGEVLDTKEKAIAFYESVNVKVYNK